MKYRRDVGVLVVSLIGLNTLACFRGLDASKLKCNDNKYCPSGYVCGKDGKCLPSGSAASDAANPDGSRSEVAADGKSDRGAGGGGGQLDAYRSSIPDGAVDVPDPGTGGTGGTGDTGGVGGTVDTGGTENTASGGTTAGGGSGGTGGANHTGGASSSGSTVRDTGNVDASSPLGPGASCKTGAECASTFCADGVCCDAKCDGQCETCNSAGKCTVAPAGPAPSSRTACAGTGTCGSKCDGQARSCVYPGGGVTCSDPTCSAGSVIAAGSCNGSGTCAKPEPTPCSTGVCGSNGQCADKCTTSSCPSGFYCNSAGACAQKKAPGVGCGNSGECASTAPVCGIDGVCCESACEGECQACDSSGKCVAVASGSPRPGHPACKAYDAQCAGSCNGASTSCVYPDTTKQCTAASCTNNQLSLNNRTACNGNGSCTAASTTPCASGYYCKDASCNNQQGGSGAICNAPIECGSGLSCISNNTGGNRCCSSAQIACNGSCTSPDIDSNCGSCGTTCGSNKSCQSKQCKCTAGTLSCGSCAGSDFEKTPAGTTDGFSAEAVGSYNRACCAEVVAGTAHGGSRAIRFTVDANGSPPPPSIYLRWNFCSSGSSTVNSLTMYAYSTENVSFYKSLAVLLDAAGNELNSTMFATPDPVSVGSSWTPISVNFDTPTQASGVALRLNNVTVASSTFYFYLDDLLIQ